MSQKEKINVDLEFEIQAERHERRRVVHGEEFDVVTGELWERLERLSEEMWGLKEELERLKKVKL